MDSVDVQIYADSKTAQYTGECVRTLVKGLVPGMRVSILDCDSGTDIPSLLGDAPDNVPIRLFKASGTGCSELAMQELLQNTDAKYILPLKASDLLFPGKLRKMLLALDANPQYSVVYGKAREINPDKSDTGRTSGLPFSHFNLPHQLPLRLWGALVRTVNLMRVGGWQPSAADPKVRAADYRIIFKLALFSDFLFLDTFTVFHRNLPEWNVDEMQVAMEDVRADVMRKNAGHVSAVFGGDPHALDGTKKYTVMLVLGILAEIKKRQNLKLYSEILELALRFQPDDFYLYVRKYDFLRSAKCSPDEAMRLAQVATDRWKSDNCALIVILPIMLDVLKRLKAPSNIFQNVSATYDKVLDRYTKLE